MTGFYTSELRHLVANLRAEGRTMPGSKHQLDPQYLDGWFWKVLAEAEAEDMEQTRADMVTAGARYRAQLPKRQVQEVLARHRAAVAQREAHDLQIRKRRLRLAMFVHGIEPLTDRERLVLRIHQVVTTDLAELLDP